MNKIKLILSTCAVVIFVFGLIIVTSCNKGAVKYNDTNLVRPCENVICLNGGTCQDGYCYCPQGFEGVKCETRWSDKFVGNYLADDDCDTSTVGNYNAVINADPDYAYKLRLYNVGLKCSGSIINAIINPEKTSFAIPMQLTCGDIYLSGYGNLNGTYVNVYLTSRDTVLHTSTQCSIVLSKQ